MGRRKVPLEVVSWGVLALISTLIVSTFGICEFTPLWRGEWFLDSMHRYIYINRSSILTRGHCISSKGDKYLMEEKEENCYRCLSIHIKHKNVLQFKETLCETYETLESVCSTLTGDAPLHSLFRSDENAEPTDCPFRNLPLSFSYNRGSGECNSPLSMVDACSENSQLIFRYQACPDIKGSESSTEVLTCLGFWKEGLLRYFMGKVHFVQSNKTEFRCFLYEKGVAADKTIFYNLAQSGDQSCTGLMSAVDGSNVMLLFSMPATKTKCKYPLWITEHNMWHTLDSKTSYVFSRKNGTLFINSNFHLYYKNSKHNFKDVNENSHFNTKIICHSQVLQNESTLIAIAHMTRGCETSYSCIAFFRRDTDIIEVMQSKVIIPSPEDVCSSENFNMNSTDFVTLLPLHTKKKPCPYPGKYAVNGQGGSFKNFITETRIYSSDEVPTSTLRAEQNTGRIIFTPATLTRSTTAPRTTFPFSDSTKSLTIPNNFNITNTTTSITTTTTSTTIYPPYSTIKPDTKNCNRGVFKRIDIGCSISGETMEFIHNCNRLHNAMYFCHGNWIAEGRSYLVVSPVSRKSSEPKFYCLMWKPIEGDVRTSLNKTMLQNIQLHVSAAISNCHRTITPGVSGTKNFNLSIVEFCDKKSKGSPTSGSPSRSIAVPTLLFLLIVPSLVYAAR